MMGHTKHCQSCNLFLDLDSFDATDSYRCKQCDRKRLVAVAGEAARDVIQELVADELAATVVMLMEAMAEVRRLRDGINHTVKRCLWEPYLDLGQVIDDLTALVDEPAHHSQT